MWQVDGRFVMWQEDGNSRNDGGEEGNDMAVSRSEKKAYKVTVLYGLKRKRWTNHAKYVVYQPEDGSHRKWHHVSNLVLDICYFKSSSTSRQRKQDPKPLEPHRKTQNV